MSEVPTAIILKGRRKTAAERVHQVVQWILSGASEFEITEAAEKLWNVEARPLIVKAMAAIVRDGDGDPSTVRAWAVQATRLVHQRALQAGDNATALRAIKQVTELSRE